MAKPKEKELGGSRNMRMSTKIIIGVFAVIMALSMMLPSLSAIFASRPADEGSAQEESAAEATENTEAQDKEKAEDAQAEQADADADPKVPDNESLKSLEENYSEKASKYKERLAEDPNDLAALLNLGETYMNWGYSAKSSSSTDEEKAYAEALLKKATSYYDRYLKLNDSATVRISHALTEYYVGDTQAAIDELEKVCEDYPQNPLAQAQLGYLYESQYDTEKASEAYRKAAELDADGTYGIKGYANQRLISLNAKVSSLGDSGEANVQSTDSSEGQSELLQKLSQNSDATI